MRRYRKRPVVIDAIQFTGEPDNVRQILADTDGAITQIAKDGAHGPVVALYVRTLEGVFEARPGDWIIRGIQGEVYPCKPTIFEATYEPVEPDAGGPTP